MSTGAITETIDVAQMTLYAFWIFFAGLIYYLHRENKREGYPLESEIPGGSKTQGFPSVPPPKTYLLRDGSKVTVPSPGGPSPQSGPASGNPLLAGVGPGAYAARADVPDRTLEGEARIVPLRTAPGFGVAIRDNDPRGLPVVGADGVVGGKVTDLWVDRAEMLFRFVELEVTGGRRVLLPINFARIDRRRVRVSSIMGRHFADVPATRSADQVTLLEEEKIMAYYGAGTLYADPARAEPLF
jgi:photosynthetic reaction center H subunit